MKCRTCRTFGKPDCPTRSRDDERSACHAYRPLLVYVAGPYTATTSMGTAYNTALANVAAGLLADMGYSPIVPHQLGRGIDPESDKYGADFWYRLTLEAMRRCDAVALMPRWMDSDGARKEAAEAERLGIPVYELQALCRVPDVLL